MAAELEIGPRPDLVFAIEIDLEELDLGVLVPGAGKGGEQVAKGGLESRSAFTRPLLILAAGPANDEVSLSEDFFLPGGAKGRAVKLPAEELVRGSFCRWRVEQVGEGLESVLCPGAEDLGVPPTASGIFRGRGLPDTGDDGIEISPETFRGDRYGVSFAAAQERSDAQQEREHRDTGCYFSAAHSSKRLLEASG